MNFPGQKRETEYNWLSKQYADTVALLLRGFTLNLALKFIVDSEIIGRKSKPIELVQFSLLWITSHFFESPSKKPFACVISTVMVLAAPFVRQRVRYFTSSDPEPRSWLYRSTNQNAVTTLWSPRSAKYICKQIKKQIWGGNCIYFSLSAIVRPQVCSLRECKSYIRIWNELLVPTRYWPSIIEYIDIFWKWRSCYNLWRLLDIEFGSSSNCSTYEDSIVAPKTLHSIVGQLLFEPI